MLNPAWLNTFKTLIDIGHFTKTAEKLFMTQPGVSQHIRKLEESCGQSLLRRDKKSFDLTEQGRQVYEYAKQLARNEIDLLEKLSFDDPFSGHYNIACSGSLAQLLYPQLLDLQSQYPQLIVQLEAAPNHRILSEVQQGRIDIGIVTHIPNPNLFDVETLGYEPLCLIFPNTHDFTGNSIESLFQLGLIRHPDVDHYLSLYFTQCGEDEFEHININEISISGYVNQINQILHPVSKELGFTVLPQSAVDSFHDVAKLKVFMPKNQVRETLFLVKKKNRALPTRFNVVLSSLKAHFLKSKDGIYKDHQ
ncbi:MAG: DNA-binding transcriptional LysR family regulator [Paraglaciecola sp.]|jgi:DNA-binding transcriptional LysR family regulator